MKASIEPQEFAVQMQEVADKHSGSYPDIEKWHMEADMLIVDLLRQIGYEKAADIFEDNTKWYS